MADYKQLQKKLDQIAKKVGFVRSLMRIGFTDAHILRTWEAALTALTSHMEPDDAISLLSGPKGEKLARFAFDGVYPDDPVSIISNEVPKFVKSAGMNEECDDDKMDEATLPSTNEEYGFFGTSRTCIAEIMTYPIAKLVWQTTFAEIKKITKADDKSIRYFLDSTSGRHFADFIFYGRAGVEFSPNDDIKKFVVDAVKAHETKWKGKLAEWVTSGSMNESIRGALVSGDLSAAIAAARMDESLSDVVGEFSYRDHSAKVIKDGSEFVVEYYIKGKRQEGDSKTKDKQQARNWAREFVGASFDKANLNEGQKLLTTIKGEKNPENVAKVYKDSDTGEFVVKFWENGKYNKNADAFETDKEGAVGTANAAIKKMDR